MKPRLPFSYAGGKANKLDWLLPLLNVPCKHFIEPFCGSACVTINRRRSELETINDSSGEIVNFFRQLRDNGEELLRLIYLTPFAREEFVTSTDIAGLSDVERARRYYVSISQSFGSFPVKDARHAGWAKRLIPPSQMSPGRRATSLANKLAGKMGDLEYIITRLRHVQMENRDAMFIIGKYDQEGVLFYCDPPYLSRRGGEMYPSEMMDESSHLALINALKACKAKVAISGYDSDLYRRELSDWYRYVERERVSAPAHGRGKLANYHTNEVVWMNYDPSLVGRFF